MVREMWFVFYVGNEMLKQHNYFSVTSATSGEACIGKVFEQLEPRIALSAPVVKQAVDENLLAGCG